ncbi:MAG: hypothetical protein EHM56_14100 [Chloroflexi bacterium]|nr:MAG: hypothetical protein EHM56_14100 [Chloroflexota bacterium]
MENDSFVGVDLSSQPISVPAGGTTMFPSMLVNIPANVTLGIHDYYVGIDGTQGTSSTPFSWNSPTASIAAIGSNGQTAGPTATTAPTNGGNGQGDNQTCSSTAQSRQSSLLLFYWL